LVLPARFSRLNVNSCQFEACRQERRSGTGTSYFFIEVLDQIHMATQCVLKSLIISQVESGVESIIELFGLAVDHVNRRQDAAHLGILAASGGIRGVEIEKPDILIRLDGRHI